MQPRLNIIYFGRDASTQGALCRGLKHAAYQLVGTERPPTEVQICGCDLLIVDLDAGEPGGFRLLQQWLRLYPFLGVLALVRRGDVGTAVQAVQHGAAACIEKPTDPAELKAAVERFLGSTEAATASIQGDLTTTERMVLAGILQGRTTKAIARGMHRSPRTVEVHRRNIRRKLHASNVVDLCFAQHRPGQLPLLHRVQ